MLKKRKTTPSPDGRGFDRWTSNGLGTELVTPLPAKNKKAVEEINREMQKRLKKNGKKD